MCTIYLPAIRFFFVMFSLLNPFTMYISSLGVYESCDSSKRKPFFPSEKQFLITRNGVDLRSSELVTVYFVVYVSTFS